MPIFVGIASKRRLSGRLGSARQSRASPADTGATRL